MVLDLHEKNGLDSEVQNPLDTPDPWVDRMWERVHSDLGSEFVDARPDLKRAMVRMRSSWEYLSVAQNYLSYFAGEENAEAAQEMRRRTTGLVDKIAAEAVSNIKNPQNSSAFEIMGLANFYTRAVRAIATIVGMNIALEKPEFDYIDTIDKSTDLEEWRRLLSYTTFIPNSPVAHYAVQQEWIAKVMWQQRGISIAERNEWLRSFYDHVVKHVEIYTPEKGKELYTAATDLENERDINGIAELGLTDLSEILLHGPGDARRVDGPVFRALMEKGVVKPDARIDGLDLMEITDPYPGIHMTQGDLLSPPPETQEWVGKKQFIFEAGSPRANQDLALAQYIYFDNLARFAAPGAYLVTDYAALEPLERTNRRVRQTQKMTAAGRPVGDVPIQPAYRRESDSDTDVGARIVPLLEYLTMAKLAGWECVNLPRQGSQEWWDLLHNVQDKEWLMQNTEENRNALRMPFYYAGEASDGAMVRSTLIFKKVTPDPDLDVVSSLQQTLFAAQDR